MPAAVAWISFTPVKGLRIQHREEAMLSENGLVGDRAFFLVDVGDRMVSSTRVGSLVSVLARHDERAGTLSLRFPDGGEVYGAVELGEPARLRFHAGSIEGRPVLGAFSDALSTHGGRELRLFAAPSGRPAVDRRDAGAVTLLSRASLERLRAEAAADGPVDPRRFRMTFGLDGLAAHEEDEWIGRRVRIGEALVSVSGNVGRCALTTRNADSGVVDIKTMHHLESYRATVPTTEPLPFGVCATVLEPGRVRVGDPVTAGGAN